MGVGDVTDFAATRRAGIIEQSLPGPHGDALLTLENSWVHEIDFFLPSPDGRGDGGEGVKLPAVHHLYNLIRSHHHLLAHDSGCFENGLTKAIPS